MFGEYVYKVSQASYTQSVLLIDADGLEETEHYSEAFREHGFEVIIYENDLRFRLNHETKLKGKITKLAVIAKPADYIPYDIQKQLTTFEVSYASLYPKLNEDVLKYEAREKISQELLLRAYQENYDVRTEKNDTRRFIERNVLGKANIKRYIDGIWNNAQEKVNGAATYKDWLEIANIKANIDTMAVEYEMEYDTSEFNAAFRNWAVSNFGKLSTVIDKSTPILVSKVMEYCRDRSDKFVLVVMDGMSEFDWNVWSRSFTNLRYHKTSVMAMIPTVTSVSRQCLLGGKYPNQLEDPWHQAKEKSEFINCAKSLGFKESHIEYQRGYNAEFGSFTRCGTVIIMDIDENVHGQKQGRIGMFNDVTVMGKQRKLQELTERLLRQGFDVYITADHGNTPCVGIGKLKGTGVETETKSHRMMVMKDFADKEAKIDAFHLTDYPKYYLPKEYDYLICDVGESFDNKGDEVMNHGGITLDEVVVPFITLKAEEYNG